MHILKPIITVRSLEPVVRNFHRKSSNDRIFQFFGTKFIYQSSDSKTQVFKRKNLTYLILRTNCVK